jgi:ferredoxin
MVKIIVVRSSDGKTIEAEWNPAKETIKEALHRAGLPKLAYVDDAAECPTCNSQHIFEDGRCAVCMGYWPR